MMRVDVIFESPLSDLWGWARAHAEAQGMTLAEFVDRCVEIERRKVEGSPRLDPRTRHVGRKGAAVQLKEHEYLASEVATLAGLAPGDIAPLADLGVIRSSRPTGRGKPGAYSNTDVLLAALAGELHSLGVPAHVLVAPAPNAAEALRKVWPRTLGLVVLANRERAILCGEAHISARAREMSPCVFVHLERLARAVEDRMRAAA